MNEPIHSIHPATPRWTHIALRVTDMDSTLSWYTKFTPMELLDEREDQTGRGAWLGMPEPDNPFILVLAQFSPELDPFKGIPKATLAPFAHLGIEMPTQHDVDAIAEQGSEAGCLAMPPTMMPPPIGYICMLRDPDGNMVEFSWDQGVYVTARQHWGG